MAKPKIKSVNDPNFTLFFRGPAENGEWDALVRAVKEGARIPYVEHDGDIILTGHDVFILSETHKFEPVYVEKKFKDQHERIQYVLSSITPYRAFDKNQTKNIIIQYYRDEYTRDGSKAIPWSFRTMNLISDHSTSSISKWIDPIFKELGIDKYSSKNRLMVRPKHGGKPVPMYDDTDLFRSGQPKAPKVKDPPAAPPPAAAEIKPAEMKNDDVVEDDTEFLGKIGAITQRAKQRDEKQKSDKESKAAEKSKWDKNIERLHATRFTLEDRPTLWLLKELDCLLSSAVNEYSNQIPEAVSRSLNMGGQIARIVFARIVKEANKDEDPDKSGQSDQPPSGDESDGADKGGAKIEPVVSEDTPDHEPQQSVA